MTLSRQVIPNGSDHALSWRAEHGSFWNPRGRPFVLCIGRPQAHKNPELFLRIAPAPDAIGIDIVMTDAPAVRAYASTYGAWPANLHFVGRLSDDSFAQALDDTLCFALQSRMEGFGLPAVEAMARGCPVVASSAPSLPETCAGAALLADPEDPGDLDRGDHGPERTVRFARPGSSPRGTRGRASLRGKPWRSITSR